MINEIRVPFLGDGIDKVTISCWHRKIGDVVDLGDDVAEVEADKAIFNIACEQKGRLVKILTHEGQEAPVGQAIAITENV